MPKAKWIFVDIASSWKWTQFGCFFFLLAFEYFVFNQRSIESSNEDALVNIPKKKKKKPKQSIRRMPPFVFCVCAVNSAMIRWCHNIWQKQKKMRLFWQSIISLNCDGVMVIERTTIRHFVQVAYNLSISQTCHDEKSPMNKGLPVSMTRTICNISFLRELF